MEPTTTAIMTALSAGAAFVGKEAATQVVKDSYYALKRWLQSHYAHVSIVEVEEEPTSKLHQEIVGKNLERGGASEDTTLIKLAGTVLQVVQEQALDSARSIGVDLGLCIRRT